MAFRRSCGLRHEPGSTAPAADLLDRDGPATGVRPMNIRFFWIGYATRRCPPEEVTQVGDQQRGRLLFSAAPVDQSRHLVVSGFETVNNSR